MTDNDIEPDLTAFAIAAETTGTSKLNAIIPVPTILEIVTCISVVLSVSRLVQTIEVDVVHAAVRHHWVSAFSDGVDAVLAKFRPSTVIKFSPACNEMAAFGIDAVI